MSQSLEIEENQTYVKFLLLYLNSWLLDTLEHLILFAVVYFLVCLGFYNIIHRRLGVFLLSKTCLPSYERVLFVIAHPDDESMFFGPTILSLAEKNCRIFLLCLSNGNYENQGSTRKTELWNACKSLRIEEENITMLNATNLQDNPNSDWKTETIAKYVLKELETLDIQLLITFDRNGVSHHKNHSAIYYAVASLCLSGFIPKNCKILTLDSINLFRKYMSIFDLPISYLMSTKWCILNWKNRKIVQNAMKQHKSQLKWFRQLYITFSRYMLINSLQEMNVADVELEMEINNF